MSCVVIAIFLFSHISLSASAARRCQEIKAKRRRGTQKLKWQCSTNYHLY